MKKTAAAIIAILFLLVGCASGGTGVPEDFVFSISTTTQGRETAYHSEGNLLIKRNTAKGSAEYTAELVLTDSELRTAWDLFSMMNLDNYPDAPDTYDPGTPEVQPGTDVKLYVRYGDVEKMIFAEDISMRGNPDSADGIAFMNTVEILIKMITGTEEYLSMPDWEY